jgi:hypothetical protein
MRMLFACTALVTLAACGSEEPAPEPAETVAVAPEVEPTLPAPDQATFTVAFAEACPTAQAVSTALCRSQGLGREGFICDYGLGNDEYRRHSATLVPGEGKWVIADPETTCAAGA